MRDKRRDLLKALTLGSGAAAASKLPTKWTTTEVQSVLLPAHAMTTGDDSSPQVISPTVTTDSADGGLVFNFSASGTVVDEGSASVFRRGFVLSNSMNPTIADTVVLSGSGLGSFSVTNESSGGLFGSVYIRAFGESTVGVSYGVQMLMDVQVCLAEGTLVALACGGTKPIEDIAYEDELLVWNFDECRFDSAKPICILQSGNAKGYNHLRFDDGSELRTIVQHRIFNRQAGRFTYPMSEETPLGTVTFKVDGTSAMLIDKKIVPEPVKYYNVITDFHMNLFGNGILTSVGYNNLYPIRNMRFVKDNRLLIAKSEYEGIPDIYYHGLRLGEQIGIRIEKTRQYVETRVC